MRVSAYNIFLGMSSNMASHDLNLKEKKENDVKMISCKSFVFEYCLKTNKWIEKCEGYWYILNSKKNSDAKYIMLNIKNTNDFAINFNSTSQVHMEKIVMILSNKNLYGVWFKNFSEIHDFYLRVKSAIQFENNNKICPFVPFNDDQLQPILKRVSTESAFSKRSSQQNKQDMRSAPNGRTKTMDFKINTNLPSKIVFFCL
ncbi:hypothetical protein HZS_6751 [Henneguya salminicola]|nr:hypothetical protein HZS_6751 [Henneguya salminicola]